MLRLFIRLLFYPTLIFNRLMCALGIWRGWDWVDEHVAIGNLPSRRRLELLRDQHVGGLINLCEEHAGHVAKMKALGLVQLHLPTLDYHSPTDKDIERALHFIARQMTAGQKVYIHCKAGRGRSATVVLCYLIARYRLTAEQAFERLKKLRPHIDRNIQQRDVVQSTVSRARKGEVLLPGKICPENGACLAP